MIHLYHGDGKGKTTAACGLALRAAGSGMKVLFVQFFKNGTSSEVKILSSLPQVTVVIPEVFYGRYKKMTDEQRKKIHECYGSVMKELERTVSDYDLIVLDESVSAYNYDMFDRTAFLEMLDREGKEREIVLTGRDPADELVEAADYVTEMRKQKHPFDKGIMARKGIEF